MELTDETVTELVQRINTFAESRSAASAESFVAERIAAAREPFTVHGIDSTPKDAIAQHEIAARQQWDRESRSLGAVLEVDLQLAQATVVDQIAAKRALTPTIEPVISRQERQLEELVTLFSDDKYREQAKRQTRREFLARYESDDEATQAGRRFVAFVEVSLSSMEFCDDPNRDADVMAISALRSAIEKRQLARVPKELLDRNERLDRAQRSVSFTETMRHLRSGRGIAYHPKPTVVKVV